MKAQFFPPSVRTNVEGKFAFWRMWHSLKSGCEAPPWFLSLPCPANVAPFLWSLSTSFPNHEPGGSCASQKLGLRLYVILNRRETDKPFSLFQGTKTEYVRKILHPGLIVEGLQGFFRSDTSDRWHSRRDGSVEPTQITKDHVGCKQKCKQVMFGCWDQKNSSSPLPHCPVCF